MHLGLGEEAIAAGVVGQLRDGDALALDYRGTAPLLVRGADAGALLSEFMGRPDGLCAGQGGHMHLFSKELLAASSGIVGAAGPLGAGFALAAQYLRPQSVAVAFFGDGAVNQGMLLEAFNLAVAWELPLVFVCKDNGWAITTPAKSLTGGDLVQRAAGFGLPAGEVDGADVEAVWTAAGAAIERARAGGGPTFLCMRCARIGGHFLGDQLTRAGRQPVRGIAPMLGPIVRAVTKRKGAPLRERLDSLRTLIQRPRAAERDRSNAQRDPLMRARHKLLSEPERLDALENAVGQEIETIVRDTLAGE